MAWLALESYPVDEAAVVEIAIGPDAALRFSIDKWGYVRFATRLDKTWTVCKSAMPVPKGAWIHLAATSDQSNLTVYQNGLDAGKAPAAVPLGHLVGNADIFVGKSSDCPMVAGVFPTAVLNGLVKNVQVFDRALPAAAIKQVLDDSKPGSVPDLQLNGAWCTADPQRPIFHLQPPRAWTNEPHGLIYWGGQYHLFYQKNPNGPYWGHINWGHMTSPDLYRWTEMPPALSPEPGPDSEGCWSGSVIEHAGKLALIYTGGDGHRASICLAFSADGVKFTKHPGNPVIAEPPQGLNYPEFRDPFVWREGGFYYLIIGSAVKGIGGTALLYRSEDLVTWEYRKPLLVGDRETSGVFWEMPIFVKLGDNHALIVCEVPGRASYWVGKWKDETFAPFTSTPKRLELFNHLLSPTPFSDRHGRVITMGIIPDQRSPKECWSAGWAHLYSLPRVLSTDSNGHLCQRYLEEIDRWNEPLVSFDKTILKEGADNALNITSGTCLKLAVSVKRGNSRSISLLVRRSPDGREQTELRYEWEIGRLVLDRSLSSLDPHVRKDVQETTYFPPNEGMIAFTMFLDESVMEVFVDDRAAFGTRIYPTLEGSTGVALVCVGSNAEATATAATIGRLY